MLVEDGLGNGYAAGVDKNKRLLTSAVVLDAIDAAALDGLAYNLTTDVLTLTNAVENAVLYIANTNPLQHLNLLRIAFSFGKATTAGDVITRTYVNPTGGTLVTAGTPITFLQRNLGSRFVAQGTAIKMAAVGQTQIGGTLASTRIFQDGAEESIVAGWLIPAGSALVLTVQPPAGNASMRCAITAALFYLDKG